MGELRQAGEEEHALDEHKKHKEDHSAEGLVANVLKIGVEKQRCHQHGSSDGQAVGCLHMA